jgi:hypothetical protein
MKQKGLYGKGGVNDYEYLSSIWTLRLINNCCDICKYFRFEILAIFAKYLKINYIKKTGAFLALLLN